LLREDHRRLEQANLGRLSAAELSAVRNEGQAEFSAELITAAYSTFPTDADILRALVWSPYNPDSAFASHLADHASVLMAELLRAADSPDASMRAQTLGTLGFIVRNSKRTTGDRASRSDIAEVAAARIRRALDDEDVGVRWQAVEEVGKDSDKLALSKLQELARTDPATEEGSLHQPVHPLRQFASKVLRRLQTE
jgi:hypothetical protein